MVGVCGCDTPGNRHFAQPEEMSHEICERRTTEEMRAIDDNIGRA